MLVTLEGSVILVSPLHELNASSPIEKPPVMTTVFKEDGTVKLVDLIEEAKDDFKKAVPVMVEEETLEKLGYVKLDEDDFSTRAETWGEYNYGCHNLHHEIAKKICDEFEGFPKLTWVGQFDCEYNCFFPTDKVEQARAELSKYVKVS